MRTPDGRECPYFYANYHRRTVSQEVCRLLEGEPDALRWTSALCVTCPVPNIRRANGCQNMVLHVRIGKRRWRFWEGERMLVWATCTRSGGPVKDPLTGCGQCHAPITFVVADEPDK